MPAASDDPVTGLGLACCRTHHRDDLVPVAGIPQIEVHLHLPDAREVSVTFDEPGNCQAARQVDYFRTSLDVMRKLRVRAKGYDLSRRDRDGLHLGSRGSECHDLAVP